MTTVDWRIISRTDVMAWSREAVGLPGGIPDGFENCAVCGTAENSAWPPVPGSWVVEASGPKLDEDGTATRAITYVRSQPRNLQNTVIGRQATGTAQLGRWVRTDPRLIGLRGSSGWV